MLSYSPDRDSSLVPVSRSSGSNPGPRWFVAVTHPHQEQRAADQLGNQDFPTYLPLCRTRYAIVPLWPRYLCVAFDPDFDHWGVILNTRGVLTLIRHAPSRPTALPPGVVEHLMSRTSPRGIVDDPGDAPPHIPTGAAVSVTGGPLAGLSGIVTLSATARCNVLIRLLGREVTASIDPANLTAD